MYALYTATIWRHYGELVAMSVCTMTRSLLRKSLSLVVVGQRHYTTSGNVSDRSILKVTELNGHDKGIVVLSLNRELKYLNAVSTQLVYRIDEEFQHFGKVDHAKCLILNSTNPKVFSAGMNLAELKEIGLFGDLVTHCCRTALTLSNFPLPIIAALDGLAIGGGLEMALHCDILVGSETMSAGLVESRLGIMAGGGGNYYLPRSVGINRAKELTFTAEIVGAKRCYEYGLIQHLVPQNADRNAAYLHALDIARKVIRQPREHLIKTKSIVNRMDKTL